MVQYCAAPMCKSNAFTPGISFHCFPQDDLLRKQWINKIKRDERHSVEISSSMRLCSKHFLPEDILPSKSGLRKFIRKGAVPRSLDFTSPRKNELRRISLLDRSSSETTVLCKRARNSPSSVLLQEEPVPENEDTSLHSTDKIFEPDIPSNTLENFKIENAILQSKIAYKVQRPRLRPSAVPSLFLPKPSTDRTEKTCSKKEVSVNMLDQQENRENGNIKSGRKNPKCHMCSREFFKFADVLEHLKTKHTIWFRNMDYISCCIPGCKSKSHRKIEHSIAVGEENILMFPVPHADGLFNKWKEAVLGTNAELTKDDHVCEHHFLENDIERFHRAKTPDGDIIKIQKRLPTLKPDAIPIKFLKSFHIKKDTAKKLSTFPNPVMCNSERSLTDKSSSTLNSSDSGSCAIDNKLETSNDSSIEIIDKPVDSSFNSVQRQTSYKKRSMAYSDLVKYIQHVQKPSASWSVVCTDQFTIFARWNNKFIAEKRLVIENPLTVRVFVKDWEVEMTDLVDITCVDDVSSLLEKVESYNVGNS